MMFISNFRWIDPVAKACLDRMLLVGALAGPVVSPALTLIGVDSHWLRLAPRLFPSDQGTSQQEVTIRQAVPGRRREVCRKMVRQAVE